MTGMVSKWMAILALLAVAAACTPAAPETVAPAVVDAPSATVAPAATAEAPIPLKFGMFNYASFAPIYFAQQEGYFADEGLDVELVTMASENEAIPAVSSGEIDAVGYTLSAGLFNSMLEGLDVKVVADKGFLDPSACPANAWVISKQAAAAGLRKPADLKGKNTVVMTGGIFQYSFEKLLTEGGLTMADVNNTIITDNAARVEALQSGATDVASLGEPFVTFAQKAGGAEVWYSLADITPNLPLGLIVYGPTILDQNPEVGVRFMKAYLRGVDQFLQGKTDRNVELIAQFTKMKPEDVKAMCWNSFRADGGIDTATALDFQQWAVDQGLMDQVVSVDKWWTDEFVLEAAKELGK